MIKMIRITLKILLLHNLKEKDKIKESCFIFLKYTLT